MKSKKGLKAIVLASSVFFAANLTSCSVPYIKKHRIGNVYKHVKKPKHKYLILTLAAETHKEPSDKKMQDRALRIYDDFKELGFSDDDIYFLVSHRYSEVLEKSDDSFTNKKFKEVCSELAGKMTKDDALIFYYIGHGREKKYEVLGDAFNITTLESELDKLKYEYAILIIESCNSGSLAKRLGKKNRISISNTSEGTTSWIDSEFSIYLMKALNGEKEADKNNDNRVSLEEAVYYAAKEDPWSIKGGLIRAFFPQPQIYYEEIDPSEVFLKE